MTNRLTLNRQVGASHGCSGCRSPPYGGTAGSVLQDLEHVGAEVILWLLFSLVFSVLIEWAGMLLWWPEEGVEQLDGRAPAADAFLYNSKPQRLARMFHPGTR